MCSEGCGGLHGEINGPAQEKPDPDYSPPSNEESYESEPRKYGWDDHDAYCD